MHKSCAKFAGGPRFTSVQGYWRYQTKQWWRENHFSGQFCGIYNSGMHLYVWPENKPPGSFIEPPIVLRRFPFNIDGQFGIKSRDVRFIHKGHEFGSMGGKATVFAYRGENPQKIENTCNIVIPACHIAFVISASGDRGLVTKLQPAVMSSFVLEW
jgi:hypothetical protein